MVSNLTVGKKDYEDVQDEVKKWAITAQELKDEFLRIVDLDTLAFNKVMDAFRMKKKTDEQKKEREAAVQEATKEATLVPFSVLEMSLKALELARYVALHGNKNSVSDAGVAGLTAQTAAEGAYYNVIINLPNLQDREFKSKMRRRATTHKNKSVRMGNEIREIVRKELKSTKAT